jgi:uncharacterized delta-60 repeat protein
LRPLIASTERIYCAGATDAAGTSDPAIFAFDSTGAPDTSFDTDAYQSVDPGADYSEAIILLEASNGDLIAAGNVFGSPTAFRGFRATAMGALVGGYSLSGEGATQVGLLVDTDKLLLAGGNGGDWWIRRYNANATSDNGFGTNGLVTGPAGSAHGIVETSDGIIVVGISDGFVASASYDSQGNPVTTYGDDGVNVTGLSLGTRAINAAVRDDQGRIVFVGHDNYKPAVVRLLPNGYPDSSFGVGGKVVFETGETIFAGRSSAFGVALDPLGRILVVGTVGDPGFEKTVVARVWH